MSKEWIHSDGRMGNLPAGEKARLTLMSECTACRINTGEQDAALLVNKLVSELFDLACMGSLPRWTASRRPECHIRQIAMYLCRVILSMSYRQIGGAFARDRSTVVHACAVVEDRRDIAAYDAFLERCERCERCVRAVFAPVGKM